MSEIDDQYPVKAPGWLAIDQALTAAYPGQTPHQYLSKAPYDLNGRSPLPAVSVVEGAHPDHWVYVTYGLSELYEKAAPNPELSGLGFELTLRLPREPGQVEPPGWGVQLLQGVGHHALSQRGGLDSGVVVGLGGPICPHPLTRDDGTSGPSAIEAVMCVPDPRLAKLDTVHGSVLFLALFGLDPIEAQTIGDWPLARRVGMVREIAPSMVVDPGRAAFAERPRTATVWRRYATGVLID